MSDSSAKILCVDDDHGQRLLLSYLLERHGLDVRTATGGEEAVAIAQDWVPDLILMDLMMPGMDGFQAAEILRADPRTADIPILALTAYGEEKMQVKAKEIGINGFVAVQFRCGNKLFNAVYSQCKTEMGVAELRFQEPFLLLLHTPTAFQGNPYNVFQLLIRYRHGRERIEQLNQTADGFIHRFNIATAQRATPVDPALQYG